MGHPAICPEPLYEKKETEMCAHTGKTVWRHGKKEATWDPGRRALGEANLLKLWSWTSSLQNCNFLLSKKMLFGTHSGELTHQVSSRSSRQLGGDQNIFTMAKGASQRATASSPWPDSIITSWKFPWDLKAFSMGEFESPSLQNCEKINFCGWRHSVSDILAWHLQLTNTAP
jgi:hypothetical protein